MRELKFRAWDKEELEMISPDKLLTLYNNRFLNEILVSDKKVTLMQYTGLKDRNGVEIYEGDIVQVSGSDGYYVTAKVVYECGAFWFYAKNISLVFEEDCDNMVMLGSMYIEHGDGGDALDMVGVVGNVHQNPDLLRKEQ